MEEIELGQRERRASSATSTDGLMAASIDMTSLAKRDVSALVKNIEDTRRRLKELEVELAAIEGQKARPIAVADPVRKNGKSRSPTSSSHHGPPVPDYSIEAYMEMSMLDILKQRLPWLAGLLMLQSVSASIMHGFDDLLEKHLVIAMFIPMIVGSGGNAGNQPGVMVTRALGIGEFRKPGLLRAFIKRECTVISIIATILSVFSFIRVLIEYPDDTKSAFAISMAMWSVVAVSVFLGIGFSVMMDRYGIDPAAGSAPTLTTIADLLGITLLCVMALIVLGK